MKNIFNIKITEHIMSKPILSIYACNEIYVGHGNELYCLSRNKVLYHHSKSIKHISGNEYYIGTASYDGTAAIYEPASDKVVEMIEGPDTEMKWIDFGQSQIAISTRGKTVWILDGQANDAISTFEVSRIIEDHTQDVKGCRFFEGRLYSWSFDCTVKMYEIFETDCSWELIQSLDLEGIVWNVVFYCGHMCCVTELGVLWIFEMKNGLWCKKKQIILSKYPIRAMCIMGHFLCIVVNRNYLIFLNEQYEIINSICLKSVNEKFNNWDKSYNNEIFNKDSDISEDKTNRIIYFEEKPLNLNFDIMCCSYSENLNTLACGCENGIVFLLVFDL